VDLSRRSFFGAWQAIAGAAALLALAAPGSAGAADPSPQDGVIVYSDRHQVEDQQIFDAFTKETGIKVELVDGEFDDLLQQLKAPTPPNAASADLLISSGAATLWQVAQNGLFQLLPAGSIDPATPGTFCDPQARWVGLAYWGRVIVVRKDALDPAAISAYDDLADPKLRGRILVRSGASPYNLALVAAEIDAEGAEAADDWARGLVANFARPPQGGDSDQLEALAEGEADLALVNTKFWARFAASDKVTDQEVVEDLGVVFPDQQSSGTEIDLAGVGLLKTATHPKSALQLIRFLLRPDVEGKFAAGDFEYPVRTDVAPPPVLARLGPFKKDEAALAKLGPFERDAETIVAKAGWE
jgi:iron(III) transport system substrate-binding protein